MANPIILFFSSTHIYYNTLYIIEEIQHSIQTRGIRIQGFTILTMNMLINFSVYSFVISFQFFNYCPYSVVLLEKYNYIDKTLLQSSNVETNVFTSKYQFKTFLFCNLMFIKLYNRGNPIQVLKKIKKVTSRCLFSLTMDKRTVQYLE